MFQPPNTLFPSSAHSQDAKLLTARLEFFRIEAMPRACVCWPGSVLTVKSSGRNDNIGLKGSIKTTDKLTVGQKHLCIEALPRAHG